MLLRVRNLTERQLMSEPVDTYPHPRLNPRFHGAKAKTKHKTMSPNLALHGDCCGLDNEMETKPNGEAQI